MAFPDRPLITPLGDRALTVAFGETLTLVANARAITAARALSAAALPGVTEITPNLVSVYVGYVPRQIAFTRLAGEIALVLAGDLPGEPQGRDWTIETDYRSGPDLAAVAGHLTMTPDAFVARHGGLTQRVLALGFAPGFTYCGLHEQALHLPRRRDVRRVPAGAVLFAAGQTALCATDMPTGWWMIGTTRFCNFDAQSENPVALAPGDRVRFAALS